jgi:hypothetical protein
MMLACTVSTYHAPDNKNSLHSAHVEEKAYDVAEHHQFWVYAVDVIHGLVGHCDSDQGEELSAQRCLGAPPD